MLGTGNAPSQSGLRFWKVNGAMAASTLAEMPISATVSRRNGAAPAAACGQAWGEEGHRFLRLDGDAITAPVAPLMPLGRSTAMTAAAAALIAATAAAAAPSSGRLRPAPNSASMTRSAFAEVKRGDVEHLALPERGGLRRIALQPRAIAEGRG